MQRSYLIVALSIALLSATNAIATPQKASPLLSCKILGIMPIKEYVTRTERSCFKKASGAEAKGLSPFNGRSNQAVKKADRDNRCNFVGVELFGAYFASRQVECFTSTKNAVRRKYTKLFIPTPTPTATPTSTQTPIVIVNSFEPPTVTPTPTPTPAVTLISAPFVADPDMSWNVAMGPAGNAGPEYQGACQAAFNKERSLFRYACRTNFTSDYESHIEPTAVLVGKWCIHPLPTMNFEQICPIVTDTDRQWAQLIMSEQTIVSIHLAKGAANQAIAGLIKRNP